MLDNLPYEFQINPVVSHTTKSSTWVSFYFCTRPLFLRASQAALSSWMQLQSHHAHISGSKGCAESLDSLCLQPTSHRSRTQDSTQNTLSTGPLSGFGPASAAEPTELNYLGALIALIAESKAAVLWTAASTRITRYANNSSPNNATVANVGTSISDADSASSGYQVKKSVYHRHQPGS